MREDKLLLLRNHSDDERLVAVELVVEVVAGVSVLEDVFLDELDFVELGEGLEQEVVVNLSFPDAHPVPVREFEVFLLVLLDDGDYFLNLLFFDVLLRHPRM